jgi:hypothetical protein
MQDNQEYLETCQIEQTVWRSKRINSNNDELVVARGTDSGKPGYFMAWEVKEERPECISWNGKCCWYPRMFWADIDYENSVVVMDFPEFLCEEEPSQKSYYHKIGSTVIFHNDNYYLKLKPFDKDKFIPVVKTDRPDSFSAAVSYVQWFNENHKQISKHGKLLSQTKKAKKRRRNRLEAQIYKKLG